MDNEYMNDEVQQNAESEAAVDAPQVESVDAVADSAVNAEPENTPDVVSDEASDVVLSDATDLPTDAEPEHQPLPVGTFDSLKARLDEIVELVSDDSMPLEDALTLYEEAVGLGLQASNMLEADIALSNAAFDSAEADAAAQEDAAIADADAEPEAETASDEAAAETAETAEEATAE